MKTFMRSKCQFCERPVTNSGFGAYQHMKGHYNRTFGKSGYVEASEMWNKLTAHRKNGGVIQ